MKVKVIKRIRRDGLSLEETQARALLAAEKEATVAMEDGDYVGVIFDENDFRETVGDPVDGALLKSDSTNLNRINANSIGYAPANLKVITHKGGNILTMIPTGKISINEYISNKSNICCRTYISCALCGYMGE